MIKTDFGEPLLLPSLESSIQMQIALNPINPFRHLYASVSACVCLDAFLHVHNSHCAHTHTHPPSLHPLTQRERAKIVQEGNRRFFQATLSDAHVCIL